LSYLGQDESLHRDWLRPGVHITAMGADTAGKQEHQIPASEVICDVHG
jgi:ornithine cyclodeaminase/alanine dehydrogenase-like protein (mu-crystallin family)